MTVSGNVSVAPGFAFSFTDGRDGPQPHLFFIASKPSIDPILILNFTTPNKFSCTRCLIQVGEHEFVTHETCIAWDSAQFTSRAYLREWYDDGTIRVQQPLSQDLIEKVWCGAEVTLQLTLEYRDLLVEQDLIMA
jgi:hypothetical protein